LRKNRLIWAAEGDTAQHFLDWDASDTDAIPYLEAPEAADKKPPPQRAVAHRRSSGAAVVEAAALLAQVPPSSADDYDTWVRVGMACHHADPGPEMMETWARWSQSSGKYRDGECGKKWAGFADGHSSPVTLATVAHLAGKVRGGASATSAAAGVPDVVVEAILADRRMAATWQKKRRDIQTAEEYHHAIARLGLELAWNDSTISAALVSWHSKHGGTKPDAGRIIEAHRTLAGDTDDKSDNDRDLEALGTLLGHPVDAIQRVGGDEMAIYYLVLSGTPPIRIRIGDADAMMTRNKFRSACFGSKYGPVVQVSVRAWDQMLILMKRVMENVDEVDSDPSATLVFWLRKYLKTSYDGEEWQKAFEYNAPLVKDGSIYFHGPRLSQWLISQAYRVTHTELYHQLRRLGFKGAVLSHNKTSRYYRAMPVTAARDLGILS